MVTYREVIEKANSDSAFRSRLLTTPTAALRELGVDLPEGVEVCVHESGHGELHFVLPANWQSYEASPLATTDPVLAQVMEKALLDPAYRERLLSDTKPALCEVAGDVIDEGLCVYAHADSEAVMHLIVPGEGVDCFELEAESLEAVVGGGKGGRRKGGMVTSLRKGEEGGGGTVTTLAVGEEGGGGTVTTAMVGEEGGTVTTMAVGEEGGGGGPIPI